MKLKESRSGQRNKNPGRVKDIVPLIDDHEVEEDDEAVHDVVEVVLAVALDVKLRASQERVAARLRLIGQVLVAVERDSSVEQLHAHNGVDVVEQLQPIGNFKMCEDFFLELSMALIEQ